MSDTSPGPVDAAGPKSTPAPESKPEGPKDESRLKRLAVRGTLIEIGGYGVTQAIRLCSNLILSRLLFPEAYGLTAIAGVFLFAVGMLSDVGIRTCVIRSPHGDDPKFLQTAWSLHITRGMMLFAVTCAIAWPIAWIYKKPVVAPIIAVSALSFLIEGFESTRVMTLARQVKRGPLVVLELATMLCSLVVTITWATLSPSVWALVAGGVGSTLFHTIGSHFIPPRRKHKFGIDPESVKEFRSFGKWVFGSSAFTFLSQEGDRLLLGYFLDLATLGVYSIAGLLSSAIGAVISRLSQSVVFGVLSTTVRERPEDLKRVYYAARWRLDLLAMPALGVTLIFGPTVVSILYDDRYHAAGWMLQILCVRVALSCLSSPASACLIALGEPRQTMFGQIARFVVIWAGIPIGWHFGGLTGVLWAAASSELGLLFALWVACIKRDLFRASREALALGAFGAGIGAGFAMKAVATPWVKALLMMLRELKNG